MKHIFYGTVIAVFLWACMASTGYAQYRQGGQWVGANFSLVAGPVGFGVEYENGMQLFEENFSLGGRLRYWSWTNSVTSSTVKYSRSIIDPEVFSVYHFQPGENVDPYAGVSLSYLIYGESWTSSKMEDQGRSKNAPDYPSNGLFFSLIGGTRYFFSPKWSGRAELELNINLGNSSYGDYSPGVLLLFGVNYTL